MSDHFTAGSTGSPERLLPWGAKPRQQHLPGPCPRAQGVFWCWQQPGAPSPEQRPAASSPPAKTPSAPEESQLHPATEYRQRRLWQSHLSESHVREGHYQTDHTSFPKDSVSIPQLWRHFKKISIYSVCCAEPLNSRISNPITVSGTIRKVLLSHPYHDKRCVPAVPAGFSP